MVASVLEEVPWEIVGKSLGAPPLLTGRERGVGGPGVKGGTPAHIMQRLDMTLTMAGG